jgi:hypothetical protein
MTRSCYALLPRMWLQVDLLIDRARLGLESAHDIAGPRNFGCVVNVPRGAPSGDICYWLLLCIVW